MSKSILTVGRLSQASEKNLIRLARFIGVSGPEKHLSNMGDSMRVELLANRIVQQVERMRRHEGEDEGA